MMRGPGWSRMDRRMNEGFMVLITAAVAGSMARLDMGRAADSVLEGYGISLEPAKTAALEECHSE